MVEFNAAGTVWRGDGGGFVAQLAAPVGADGPRGSGVFTGPVGGERDVFSDGCAEVVGDLPGEPSVELVAVAGRIGGGPLGPAVRVGDLLVFGLGVSLSCVEGDCMGGVCSGVSGQWLADRVVEVLGEGLIVLSAGDGD